jgi:hypothetical protein
MHQSLSFIACRLNTAQHVSDILMPIIRSLSTAVAGSGLPLERWLQCCSSWSVPGDRSRPTTLLPPRSNGKPEAAIAVDKLLMMGIRMLETCWAVFKRHAIKLRDWGIWLVDLFELLIRVWLCTIFGTVWKEQVPRTYYSLQWSSLLSQLTSSLAELWKRRRSNSGSHIHF